MEPHVSVPIADPSDIGEARRVAASLLAGSSFDEADGGRVALAVTEAATNILKHAKKGELLLRRAPDLSDRGGFELLALDRGPGMLDVARCMQDGYSTAGSPGTGLGAISRLAARLDIYAPPDLGTVLFAQLHPRGASPAAEASPVRTGAIRLAAPGETACGDAWALAQSGARVVVLVADGLGHGPEAAHAAAEAVSAFRTSWELPLDGTLERVHQALVGTRGAAVSAAILSLSAKTVQFAGMGNVCGLIATPAASRNLVPQNGTLGGQLRPVRALEYPWPAGGCLILYTDGLSTHVGVQSYPGLLARHPSLIAGVLHRDFRRGRDDATIVVVKEVAP